MTYEEKTSIEFTRNEKISNASLIFLLLVRVLDYDVALWILGTNAPEWFLDWYNSIAYILTATIIWLNRHRLATLNNDRPFMAACILGGALYAVRTTPNTVGVLIGITAGLIFGTYPNNQFVFKNPVPFPRGAGLLILLSILSAGSCESRLCVAASNGKWRCNHGTWKRNMNESI